MLVEGEQQRVQLQYSDADDLDVAALTREVIKDENGAPVPLADLVTIETVLGVVVIFNHRLNQPEARSHSSASA